MTPREKLCKKGCVKRAAKNWNGILRCLAKAEVYFEKWGDTVPRRRVPTCDEVLNCKYRPEPEREENGVGETTEETNEDNRIPTADDISSAEETEVEN